jgi:TonB family protein
MFITSGARTLGLMFAAMALVSLPHGAVAKASDAPCAGPIGIRLADLPALAETLRAGGGCQRVELVIPVRWTYDATRQKVSLFPASSPYPAIGLSQIDLAGGDASIASDQDIVLAYLTPFARPQPRTAANVKDCLRAHGSRKDFPDQDQVNRLCATQSLTLSVRFANPTDIAIAGRFDLPADAEPALRQGGVDLRLALRLERAAISDDYKGLMTVDAALEQIMLTDGAGIILASGVSSDDLHPPEPLNAVWIRRPSGDEASRYFPERALRMGISGQATLQCRVGHLGVMRRCVVLSEGPDGAGFGDAALKMTRSFRMAPADPDGLPIAGATVKLPMRFALPEEATPEAKP